MNFGVFLRDGHCKGCVLLLVVFPIVFIFFGMTPGPAIVAGALLALFYTLDSYIYKKEGEFSFDPAPDCPVIATRLTNFILILALSGAVLLSGSFDFGPPHLRNFEASIAGIILVSLAFITLRTIPGVMREADRFNREPVLEAAKIFCAIFITIISAIAILRASESGVMAPLLQLVTNTDGAPNNAMYSCLTGILWVFLDYAPDYLIFFNSAGGDFSVLQGSLAITLLAISAGTVFMGADTFIGKLPKITVNSSEQRHGIPMSGFWMYGLIETISDAAVQSGYISIFCVFNRDVPNIVLSGHTQSDVEHNCAIL